MHVVSPGELEVEYLRDNFSFHPLDLEDCVNVAQRPKMDEYDKYIFLVLLFPYYERAQREIRSAELDFFIGPDYLITVSDGKHPLLDAFFNDCLKSEVFRERYLHATPPDLLYEILHRLQAGIFPMLDHIAEDIETIESQIYAGAEKRMVRDILITQRNIVNFRRIVNAHKSTLRKLINVRSQGVFVLSSNLAMYYGNLIERTKDIWDTLDIHHQSISAFQAANNSMISYKLNDAMKVLTAISVSVLPATLIATVFGMKTINMPLVNNPYGFWTLLIMMFSFVGILLAYFKKRDWL